MTRNEIFAKAEEMGFDRTEALKCRLSYIRQQIAEQKQFLEETMHDYDVATGLTKDFLKLSIATIKKRISNLQFEHSRLITPKEMIKGISDDDIIEARQYPIDQLVELNRNGRCRAFCHESNTESMSYCESANRLKCFVCDKSFNPIDVLVERDGYTFTEAVRELT